MSIKEAKIIIDEYGLVTDENTIEIVLEVIDKFGSAKNVLIEGLKPKYQYLKKLSKLLAMLDEKQTYDLEAEKIATLMHDIHKVVLRDSQKNGEDFLDLLRRINVRETFNPSSMELWVMQYLGGRDLIAKINLQEANQLQRRILNAISKYNLLPKLSDELLIENSTLNNIKIKNA
ncbi:MAG: hypothetical protein U9N39_02775 [Campylobacterota bacterium]|nr:hypothetical protein [Campylobacterota bacterium]